MIDWCLTCQFEDYDGAEEPCINCVSNTEVEGNAKPTEFFPKKPPKPITNADRIRAMTDEELAEFLWSIGASQFNGWVYISGKPIFSTGDGNRWLDWLRQETE